MIIQRYVQGGTVFDRALPEAYFRVLHKGFNQGIFLMVDGQYQRRREVSIDRVQKLVLHLQDV